MACVSKVFGRESQLGDLLPGIDIWGVWGREYVGGMEEWRGSEPGNGLKPTPGGITIG